MRSCVMEDVAFARKASRTRCHEHHQGHERSRLRRAFRQLGLPDPAAPALAICATGALGQADRLELLMWPCFWSAALAANADVAPDGGFSLELKLAHLFYFFIGAVAMRGAGCTYNDLVDHKIDMEVARTRSRPLPSGRASRLAQKSSLCCRHWPDLSCCCSSTASPSGSDLPRCWWWRSIPLPSGYRLAAVLPRPCLFLGCADGWPPCSAGSTGRRSGFMSPPSSDDRLRYDLRPSGQGRRCTGRGTLHARLFGEHTKAWLSVIYGLASFCFIVAFALAKVGMLGFLALPSPS